MNGANLDPIKMEENYNIKRQSLKQNNIQKNVASIKSKQDKLLNYKLGPSNFLLTSCSYSAKLP